MTNLFEEVVKLTRRDFRILLATAWIETAIQYGLDSPPHTTPGLRLVVLPLLKNTQPACDLFIRNPAL